MEKKKSRFIWEQVVESPDIYRVSEVGSRVNSYLIVSDEDVMIVDPGFGDMLRMILRLARGLGARSEKLQVFLTHARGRELLRMLEILPPGTTLYSPGNPVFWAEESREQKKRKESMTVILTAADDPGLAQGSENAPDQEGESQEKKTAARRDIQWTTVREGDFIHIGGLRLRCLRMDGARPRQAGLWLARFGILLAGNALGCDYLPEVENWSERIDTMGLQLELLRRLSNLSIKCILPGKGGIVGADQVIDQEKAKTAGKGISRECDAVLKRMLGGYSVRLLEIYQIVSGKENVSEEEFRRLAQPFESASSCEKYLLYRKYLQRRQIRGTVVYEKGTVSLTDWFLPQ